MTADVLARRTRRPGRLPRPRADLLMGRIAGRVARVEPRRRQGRPGRRPQAGLQPRLQRCRDLAGVAVGIASRHYLNLTTPRPRYLVIPGTVRWPTSRSTGRSATTFRQCSARARKTAKDARHQPSALYEVRHAVTNTGPDRRRPGPTIPRAPRDQVSDHRSFRGQMTRSAVLTHKALLRRAGPRGLIGIAAMTGASMTSPLRTPC